MMMMQWRSACRVAGRASAPNRWLATSPSRSVKEGPGLQEFLEAARSKEADGATADTELEDDMVDLRNPITGEIGG